MFEDTYFLDQKKAIEVAKQQNRPSATTLQACYYNGDKLDIDLPNLIHLPFDNLIEGLAQGIHRIPTKIDLSGLNLSAEVKHEIFKNFNIAIAKAQALRGEYKLAYYKAFKNLKPDFNKKPWRFFLVARGDTRVLGNISKNLSRTLNKMGYKAFLYLGYGTEDEGCLKNQLIASPHATINLNTFNNSFLSDDVFNFIWFQDIMPSLLDNKPIILRKRDYVFHLTEGIEKQLKRKGIHSIHQPFCIDTTIYKRRDNIKRDNKKIVFIGSSYKEAFDMVNNKNKDKVLEIFFKHYKEVGVITSIRKFYFKVYNLKVGKDTSGIVNYIERDLMLIEIVKKLSNHYTIEIYGWGWEKYDELKPYYKGVLGYGEEISEVYNSARYFLVLGGYVIQQRTLEGKASGSIPLVLDVRKNDPTYNEKYNKELVFFKNPNDLNNLLKTDIYIEDNSLIKDHSYEKFAKKIIDIIKENK